MMTLRARRHEKHRHMGVEVADTGNGIAIEEQSKLFTAFRQIQSVNGSTGLGLFIAQRIVNTMGGELRVSSALQQGTSFSFELIVPFAKDLDASQLSVVPYTSIGSAPARPQPKRWLASAIPPRSDRRDLAVLAKDGRLTDIEQWIETMLAIHPSCTAFLTEVRRCVEALDFPGAEALALAPHEPENIS
jgi:hypothetical protein